MPYTTRDDRPQEEDFESLPNKIRDELFKAHEHGDCFTENDIVYKECDVIRIINIALKQNETI